MKAPNPNQITGLTWTQVVAVLNLFFLPLIGPKSRENILKEMEHLGLKMGEVMFWTEFFPHRRRTTIAPQPERCPGITFSVPGKGQGCWFILPERGVSVITITDRPEKGSDSSTTVTAQRSGTYWTLTIDAHRNADPKYKVAFVALKSSRQAA